MLGNTIAAISTPPGKGGVAVIRISGEDSLAVASRIFCPKGSKKVADAVPRVQYFGDILLRGERIDDGLMTYFPAPGSYTGENTVEISCHGGTLITSMVLESALCEGAVLAEPGEFTRRAMMNGKISLTDAEAIGMLLEARSEGQVRLSQSGSRTRLNEAIHAIRVSLTSLLSSIFARIDYPDEDLGELGREDVLAGITDALDSVTRLAATYRTGKAIAEGVRTVICGKPNVGKSTLYNLLVGEDAAIVTDIPGTTRDVLEKTVTVGDLMLILYDTAGIREDAADEVERIGVRRSMERIESAELVLALFDSREPLTDADRALAEDIKGCSGTRLALLTKHGEREGGTDAEELYALGFERVIPVNVHRDPQGALETITAVLRELFVEEKLSVGTDAIISTARQSAAVARAKEHLALAAEAYRSGLPEDASSTDIELALGAIGELDGRAVSEEVVADIFAKFCVGK